jgi:hypothetical protein
MRFVDKRRNDGQCRSYWKTQRRFDRWHGEGSASSVEASTQAPIYGHASSVFFDRNHFRHLSGESTASSDDNSPPLDGDGDAQDGFECVGRIGGQLAWRSKTSGSWARTEQLPISPTLRSTTATSTPFAHPLPSRRPARQEQEWAQRRQQWTVHCSRNRTTLCAAYVPGCISTRRRGRQATGALARCRRPGCALGLVGHT